jgi:hypothetical protein
MVHSSHPLSVQQKHPLVQLKQQSSKEESKENEILNLTKSLAAVSLKDKDE